MIKLQEQRVRWQFLCLKKVVEQKGPSEVARHPWSALCHRKPFADIFSHELTTVLFASTCQINKRFFEIVSNSLDWIEFIQVFLVYLFPCQGIIFICFTVFHILLQEVPRCVTKAHNFPRQIVIRRMYCNWCNDLIVEKMFTSEKFSPGRISKIFFNEGRVLSIAHKAEYLLELIIFLDPLEPQPRNRNGLIHLLCFLWCRERSSRRYDTTGSWLPLWSLVIPSSIS